MIDRVHVSLAPLSPHVGTDAVFDDLAVAVAEKNVCRIVYISFHERKQIVTQIHPLRLVFRGHGWYVIAYSTGHRQVRTFKLIRIRKLTVTKRNFTPPPEAQQPPDFGDAWNMIPEGRLYDVHLHFERDVAGNVAEVRWHRSQRVEFNDDGSIEFFVRVDGLGEISWWILGYGDRATVVSPPGLRRRIADAAAGVLGKYRKPKRES